MPSADPPTSGMTSQSHHNHHGLVINTNDTGLGGVSPVTRTAHLDAGGTAGGGGGEGGAGGGNKEGADKNKSLGPSVPGSPVTK